MNSAIYFEKRRKQFIDRLDGGVAIIPASGLVTHHADCEYPFRQNSDFWYLTGFDEPNAIALFISNKPKGGQYILFVEPKDSLAEIWQGTRCGLDGAKKDFGVDVAHSIEDFPKLIHEYLEGANEIIFSIGKTPKIEAIVMQAWSNQLDKYSRNGFAPSCIRSPHLFLNEMRLYKDNYEINRIRKAANISASAHEIARNSVLPGMNERQIQGKIEGYFLEQCTRGSAYSPIVASGDNACVLHYTLNNDVLKDGNLILIDAGCSLNDYYNADITRTFPINGKFSSEQKEIYEIVLSAQKDAIEKVIKGNTSTDIHLAALRRIVDGLIQLRILTGDVDAIIEQGSYKHLYMHQTGHWLGLDVHDVGAYRLGDFDIPLNSGMVLTVEPGIYISDRLPTPKDQPEIDSRWKGIGIRIEDDILVTDNLPEILTAKALKEIKDIEK